MFNARKLFERVWKNTNEQSSGHNMSEADVSKAHKMQANLDKWLVREYSITFNLKRKV